DIILEDNDERPVGANEVGEICVKIRPNQVGLLYKYHKDTERTLATFRTGIYHTGDLATRDNDGYYWFVGRKDDIIKSSGYRIGPYEVESALYEHPAVLECAITGAPDELRGQVVKATIILTKGYTPSDALIKELQNHVKRLTAPYKYPRIIEFVTELPKTFSGKIKRKNIRNNDNPQA
ncbi:MAG: AMP-binding protein, partial [Clostridia bacterium]